MLIFKKIKIELWAIFLFLIFLFIAMIGFGSLVRYEVLSSSNKFPIVSSLAVFMAELPSNFKKGLNLDMQSPEERFPGISGFNGTPMEDEAYLLLSKYDGDEKRSFVELIDLRTFEIKKTWRPDVDKIFSLVDHSKPDFINLKRDGNPGRFQIMHPFLTEDGGLIFQEGSPLVKIDANSRLVWQNQEDIFHHTIEQDHEGNFWVPSTAYPYLVDEKYIGSEYGNYHDDAITKISPEGKILYQKSVSNILIENNLGFLLFPITSFYTRDPIHLNDIQPVLNDGPYWRRGDIFLSSRNLSMIILYRPSSNKIVWKGVGNTIAQHDVEIIDDHRISIFNNNVHQFDESKVNGNNQIVIYDFKKDSYSKYFDEAMQFYDVRAISESRGKILPSGALLVEEQNFGRLLFFNEDASLRWQYVNRADNGKIYLVKWCRLLYKQNDLDKVHKILEIEE
jgi:hypothetical protein